MRYLRIALGVVSFAGVAALVPARAGAQVAQMAAPQHITVRSRGTVTLGSTTTRAATVAPGTAKGVVAGFVGLFNRPIWKSRTAAKAVAAQPQAKSKIPKAKSLTLVNSTTGFTDLSFAGLSAVDNTNIVFSSDGSFLELEPPDQGLCVGNGRVIQMVNLQYAVTNTSGAVIVAPTSLYDLFNVPIGIDLDHTDAIFDPRCIHDAATHTFFLTVAHITVGGLTSFIELAVLDDSTLAGMLYSIDTTDTFADPLFSGGPGGPGCPCEEDQPLLGADANGLYISGNEFPISPGNFNGAVVFALSKADLVAHVAEANVGGVVAQYPFVLLSKKLALIAGSVAPAITPAGDFDTSNGGTEYFMSSVDFNDTLAKKLAVFALVNTCALPLTAATPCASPLILVSKAFGSKTYGFPPLAQQKPGDIPLGDSMMLMPPATEAPLDPLDDRMQQVTYEGGKLYGALHTIISVGGATQVGIMYASTTPSVTVKAVKNGFKVKLKAKLATNYAALTGFDLFFPSIAANQSGNVVMGLSISGATMFPSFGYVGLAGTADTSVHVAAEGMDAEDGFTGYETPFAARWGDYTVATIDASGNFWLAGEWIPAACDDAEYNSDNTCGGTRQKHANWGTALGKLVP